MAAKYDTTGYEAEEEEVEEEEGSEESDVLTEDTDAQFAKYGLVNPKKSHWIYRGKVEGFIISCIVANGIQIGLELDIPCQPNCTQEELGIYYWLERFFILVFFAEMCVKMRVEFALQHILIML